MIGLVLFSCTTQELVVFIKALRQAVRNKKGKFREAKTTDGWNTFLKKLS